MRRPHNAVPDEIEARIRELSAAGVSRVALAERFGLTRITIGRILRRASEPAPGSDFASEE